MYVSQCRIEGLEGDSMSSMDEPSRQIEVVQAVHRSDHAPRACCESGVDVVSMVVRGGESSVVKSLCKRAAAVSRAWRVII